MLLKPAPQGLPHGDDRGVIRGKGDRPSPGTCKVARRKTVAPPVPYDCFSMVKVVVVSRSLSVYSAWIDLPSEETVMRYTPTIFPSLLSVSSIVSFPIRFNETIVWPGSPWIG